MNKVASWSIAGSIIVMIFSFLTWFFANWGAITNFMTVVHSLWLHAPEMEHIIEDNHKLLTKVTNIESTKKEFNLERIRYIELSKKFREQIDSLEEVIKLLSDGKFPYKDSVNLVDNRGNIIETTTIKELMDD